MTLPDGFQPGHSQVADLELEISRVKTARLSLRVKPGGAVAIRAPQWVSERHIRRFVGSKQDWINRRRHQLKTLYSFADGQLTDTIGITCRTESKLSVKTEDNDIIISRPVELADDWWQLYLIARPAIKRLLNVQAQASLPPQVDQLNRDYNLKASDLRLRFTRSRWGSCNRGGRVMFNTQLLRLPAELQHYVLCHELAHTRHLNHSQEFHRLLRSLAPDAKQLSRRLARYQLLY